MGELLQHSSIINITVLLLFLGKSPDGPSGPPGLAGEGETREKGTSLCLGGRLSSAPRNPTPREAGWVRAGQWGWAPGLRGGGTEEGDKRKGQGAPNQSGRHVRNRETGKAHPVSEKIELVLPTPGLVGIEAMSCWGRGEEGAESQVRRPMPPGWSRRTPGSAGGRVCAVLSGDYSEGCFQKANG